MALSSLSGIAVSEHDLSPIFSPLSVRFRQLTGRDGMVQKQ